VAEYLEDEDDDFEEVEDEELREQIEELQDRLDEQDDLAEINGIIRAMEAEHGSTFTQAEVDQIGSLLEQGYTPKSVYEAVAPASEWEQDFEHAVDWLERQEGRPILQKEVNDLWEAALREGDPQHLEADAVLDLDSSSDRAAYMNERLREDEEHEPAATVEPLYEDSTPEERTAYFEARMNGAKVEETEEGDE
jgi:hypothetical protein